MKGFLVWINFPDLMKVCKVKMAFKCILTGHFGQKRMNSFFPVLTLQEVSRGMHFFPQPLSKNHWECLRKTPLMVYNRMLYSFSPASPMLVAVSIHFITMMQVFLFCPLWDLVKRRKNYELGNYGRFHYYDSKPDKVKCYSVLITVT